MSVESITELLKLKVTAVLAARAALSVMIIPVGRFRVIAFVFAPAPCVIVPPAPVLYPILDEFPLAKMVLLEVISAADIAPVDVSEPTVAVPVVVNGWLPRSIGAAWRILLSVENSTLPVDVFRRRVLLAPLVHDIVPFVLDTRT